jgi:hypothetical protein
MKRICCIGAGLLVLAAGAPAFADSTNGASTNGTASVTVLAPLTLTQTQGLDFGTITSGASSGTVTIDAAGARTVASGVGSVAADAGQQAIFTVAGDTSNAIDVVVGSNITGFSGGITGTTTSGTLPTALTSGSATFNVGGSLTIPASTTAGAYSGTYTVSVNYP